jgi:GNAT superfamily N-acetyltransferase
MIQSHQQTADKITIGEAMSHDLEPLVQLFDEYRVFYKRDSDLENCRVFLSERIANGDSKIFVSRTELGELTGFVQLYPLFSSTRMKRIWLLNDLYVNPRFRGMKISIMLIDRAKQLARDTNAAGLTLETAKTNEIGNNLYPGAGFVLDTTSNFYGWTNVQNASL